MWKIWDRKSDINGVFAEWVLNHHEFLQKEATIYIRTENGRVTNIEGKSILAYNHDIDPALPDDEFLAAYEAKLAELEEQARLEAPDEPVEEEEPTEPEPEPDETATYAELAQVYKEGVNGLE